MGQGGDSASAVLRIYDGPGMFEVPPQNTCLGKLVPTKELSGTRPRTRPPSIPPESAGRLPFLLS
jgi:hypothetical protein